MAGDLDESIGSGKPAPIGSEQMHAGEQGILCHAEARRRAGGL